MLLIATGCGDDATGDRPTVRPFSEVQDGELSFTADPGDPTRAVFHVTTTEPMICAIVWGEDGSFGRFNNSQSMNGTGIIDHDVLLPDVEPGVEYRFIVQGTTADGTLYRSEESTFTIDETATTAPDPDLGENVAVGATVLEASSSFSDAFAPELAVDGDVGTEWSTDGDGDAAFIEIDLGASIDVAAVEFLTRSMADGSAITDTFTVSFDGGASFGPFPSSTAATRRPATLSASGQVLRFEVASSTGGNVGAVEIAVYAADA
jgi:hypothetical protein